MTDRGSFPLIRRYNSVYLKRILVFCCDLNNECLVIMRNYHSLILELLCKT